MPQFAQSLIVLKMVNIWFHFILRRKKVWMIFYEWMDRLIPELKRDIRADHFQGQSWLL